MPRRSSIEDQAAHWRTESRRRAAMPFAAEIAAFLDERAAEIFGAPGGRSE
jgi:hypothetical protein